MPHHLVLQPNGNYAVWSTIIDDFLSLNYTKDEIINAEPNAIDQISHIEKSGIAWDWAGDWNSRVRWLETLKVVDTLKIIDDLRLPRRMKRKHSSLLCEKYWRFYWRNKCELLEMELRRIKRS